MLQSEWHPRANAIWRAWLRCMPLYKLICSLTTLAGTLQPQPEEIQQPVTSTGGDPAAGMRRIYQMHTALAHLGSKAFCSLMTLAGTLRPQQEEIQQPATSLRDFV